MPPKADSGLSSAQAQALAEAGWDNRPVESRLPKVGQADHPGEYLLTYFNLIFVVLAVCLLLVGDWKDMTFLLIVAANAVIGIVQQLRSKRTIEKLIAALRRQGADRPGRGGARSCRVGRSWCGRTSSNSTAGCQIPADGPVLTGQVQVNEVPHHRRGGRHHQGSLGTSCSPAASSSPASAGPGWTRWERTPMPPS